MCHYCDYHAAVPNACPECKFAGMRYSGLGTQKLEAEVRARFPDYACLRMDTDSMRAPRQPRAGAGRVSRRRGADSARHADDRQGARLSERDARGRGQCRHGAAPARFPRRRADVSVGDASGRSHGPRARRAGECWCRRCAPMRRRSWRRCGTTWRRSPARSCRIARRSVIRRSRRWCESWFAAAESTAAKSRQRVPTKLAAAGCTMAGEPPATSAVVRILGPATAPIAKLRGSFRYQIQLQSADSEHAPQRGARRRRPDLKPPEGVVWTVDVDPLDMM